MSTVCRQQASFGGSAVSRQVPGTGRFAPANRSASALSRLTAERWTICQQGHVHWGALGAAGLLLSHRRAEETAYLLAQRSRVVDQPGTWGIPGGAMRDGESPSDAARRELIEEIVVQPEYAVTAVQRSDCGGGWAFWTLLGEVSEEVETYCGAQTESTGWFTLDQMRMLDLHPEFKAWASRNLRRLSRDGS